MKQYLLRYRFMDGALGSINTGTVFQANDDAEAGKVANRLWKLIGRDFAGLYDLSDEPRKLEWSPY